MGAFDVLLMVGMKMVGNMFLNKSTDKEKDKKITPQRLKDEAYKAFKETASYTEELREKAEKIQQREMVNKSVKELREIAKSNTNLATILAANLELKQRS